MLQLLKLNLSMKKIAILLIFLFFTGIVSAQNEQHKIAFDRFVNNFNNSDFESIYNNFSVKMKRAHPEGYYLKIFYRVKKEHKSLQSFELLHYEENNQKSRAIYNANSQTGNLTIKFTINGDEIIGLFLLKDKNFL